MKRVHLLVHLGPLLSLERRSADSSACWWVVWFFVASKLMMFFPIPSYAKDVPTRRVGKLLNLCVTELLSPGNAALMRAMPLARCPSPVNIGRSEVFARFG